LSEVIQLLGDEATLPAIKTILNELGYSHKRRGIPKEAFIDFKTALIAYLKEHVSWGENIEAAWNNAIEKKKKKKKKITAWLLSSQAWTETQFTKMLILNHNLKTYCNFMTRTMNVLKISVNGKSNKKLISGKKIKN
jgi:NADPH-dependent ferric siderophore reductase